MPQPKNMALRSDEVVADIARRIREGQSQLQVGRDLGVSGRFIADRILEWEAKTGEKLPRKCRPKHQFGRDVVVAESARCGRCGLRGNHECIRGVVDFMRSGASTFGGAQELALSASHRGPL